MILTGDCLDVMPTLEPESIAAIVTDPPYGLGFMGKHWDHGMPGEDFYRQMLRVAKPGAHLLAFGGTRTYHRLAAAIEDAGWEIRDCLVWGYASGFPKSHNLDGDWDGWGTALKPAWEPIVMARKPLRGTVAANVQEHGTGALNIDATRIPLAGEGDREFMASRLPAWGRQGEWTGSAAINVGPRYATVPDGRWPANVVLTDPIFDGGIEGVVGGGMAASGGNINGRPVTGYNKGWADERFFDGYGDSGTYSRFFLIPKADRAEREPVVGLLPERDAGEATGMVGLPDLRMDRPQLRNARANTHPTVKPVDLMRHLVRLVTPPGGTVLDPFLGSGTTGIACEMEGFDWIGIEREAEYVAIAEARLQGVQRGFGLSA